MGYDHLWNRLQDHLNELSEKRSKKAKAFDKITVVGWESIDPTKYVYKHKQMDPHLANPVFTLRHTTNSPVEVVHVFLNFLTPELIRQVCQANYDKNMFWNAFNDLRGPAMLGHYEFRAYCIELSDALFLHAVDNEHYYV